MNDALSILKEAVNKYDKLKDMENRHNREMKSAGSFLDVPRVQHGQSQVPILGTGAGIAAANALSKEHGKQALSLASNEVWAVYFFARRQEKNRASLNNEVR